MQNNPCPAQSPNRPNGRACCSFPRFHSATPTPAPGTCKSANRAHHFPSGSKTQIWRQVPQAAARALPRAVAATGLGPGTLQTIESQVHFRERRLVPVSLNRQHETPTAEHLGFCFSQGPPCLGLLSLMELRFFGKAMVKDRGPEWSQVAGRPRPGDRLSVVGFGLFPLKGNVHECTVLQRMQHFMYESLSVVFHPVCSVRAVCCGCGSRSYPSLAKGPCEGPCPEPTTVPHWRHTPAPVGWPGFASTTGWGCGIRQRAALIPHPPPALHTVARRPRPPMPSRRTTRGPPPPPEPFEFGGTARSTPTYRGSEKGGC